MKTLITSSDVLRMAFSANELLAPTIITEADIVEAEYRYVRPILGEALWQLLDSQYTALRDDYVAPVVAAWTRYMVQPLLGHRCEACLANSQSDIYASTTAGNNRLDSIMQTLRSKARTLSRRLSDHLNAHGDEYPEYNPNANPLNRCSIDGDIIQIR